MARLEKKFKKNLMIWACGSKSVKKKKKVAKGDFIRIYVAKMLKDQVAKNPGEVTHARAKA